MAASPFHAGLDAHLSRIEQSLQKVSTTLIAGDSAALEVASTTLRQGMVDLASLMRAPSASGRSVDADTRKRLERISALMGQHRENLIRRAVVVDRALATVLPQAQQNPTYSAGVTKASAYKGGSARIYAAFAS